LCEEKKHWSMILLSMVLLMMLTAGLCIACTQTEIMKNAADDGKDQITGFAREIIDRDIATYESNPAVKIIDSKITRLEMVESFDELADKPIGVYALEYRLLPEDMSKAVLAGGMQVDEDGWLKETCSMGSPLLVIADNNGEAELIGILWTIGVEEDGGTELIMERMYYS